MTRLPSVLGPVDLPLAELCAARIDGELMRVGDGWCPIDEPDLPTLRAAAVAAPAPLIAERLTAAWIHGALAGPPARPQFCVPYSARSTVSTDPTRVVREVVLGEDDVVEVGGVRVTSMVRTVVDVLRDPSVGDAVAVAVAAESAVVEVALLDAVARRLGGAGRVPYIGLARERLARARGAERSLSRR